jgi:hypothetical protein
MIDGFVFSRAPSTPACGRTRRPRRALPPCVLRVTASPGLSVASATSVARFRGSFDDRVAGPLVAVYDRGLPRRS